MIYSQFLNIFESFRIFLDLFGSFFWAAHNNLAMLVGLLKLFEFRGAWASRLYLWTVFTHVNQIGTDKVWTGFSKKTECIHASSSFLIDLIGYSRGHLNDLWRVDLRHRQTEVNAFSVKLVGMELSIEMKRLERITRRSILGSDCMTLI